MPMAKVPSRSVSVPVPVWRWLTGLRDQMTADKGRTVTIAEAFEHVREVYEAARQEPAP